MAVFTATTLTLVVANRGSEKIVTTFLLGLVATFGALMALFFYGADEPIHKAFSSVVMVESASHLPYELIGFTNLPLDTLISARDKFKAHPDLRDASDSEGTSLYHHALQRAVISWLELKYPNSWEVDLLPYDLGESHGYFFVGKPGPARTYKPVEIAQRLSGNKFADLQGPFGPAPSVGLALPPGTELRVTPPYLNKQLGETGMISLVNRYCTIHIQTRQSGGRRGIGSYAYILGLDESQDNLLWTNQYTIIVDVTFQRFLTGSPDMPRYKKWASDITDGLRMQFDEQVAWSNLKDFYLLHKTTPFQPPQSK